MYPRASMKAALASMLSALLLLPGCPLGCGAYNGDGDAMYHRGDDSLLLCSNGGFVATIGMRVIEGRFEDGVDGIVGTSGDTGARAFSLQHADNGTLRSAELGDGWETVALDQTALDHADVRCTDLETRAWWAQ